jgi:phosphatidylserine/phosphatidylglycerophosphate/cardiolipin synthase-like enzyme
MNSPLHKLSKVAMLDLASDLGTGRLSPPYTPMAVGLGLPAGTGAETAAELELLRATGMQPMHIATMLKLLAAEREHAQEVADRLQLVWTGPDAQGSVGRDTGVVVRELFDGATKSVLVSTFTVRAGAEVFAGLADRMREVPNLAVRIVVNVSRAKEDGLAPDAEVVKRFAENFARKHWPWSVRPKVFYDPRGPSLDDHIRASLHAKCIVVDDEIAFITSANFTEWAQERNVEAGVLVHDPVFARALRQEFDCLIAGAMLKSLPGYE